MNHIGKILVKLDYLDAFVLYSKHYKAFASDICLASPSSERVNILDETILHWKSLGQNKLDQAKAMGRVESLYMKIV